MKKPFIIAEIGVNHDGILEKAKELIYVAKEAGADAVKFQTFIPEKLALPNTPKVSYQRANDSDRSHLEMLKALSFNFEQHLVLQDYCKQADIEFMSTPYGIEELKFLVGLGVKRIKIASADIVDIPLHEEASKLSIAIIISTGMATEIEINEAVSLYRNKENMITLMQCTSEYPSKPSNANLRKLHFLKSLHVASIGYSDHTIGVNCALVALGLGATYFEKHVTLRNSDSGPDHAASANPVAFKKYVSVIRESYEALGNEHPKMTDAEFEMSQVSRKSLHFKKTLPIGHILESEDVVLRRPGSGLLWRDLKKIVGKKLKTAVVEGEEVKSSKFEIEVK